MDLSEGYVKNWRCIEKWEWYTAPDHAHLFQHLIRRANHADGSWRGITIRRGQLFTGRHALSKQTGISGKSIRTILKHLKRSNELAIESAKRGSLITILNYEIYQSEPDMRGQEEGQAAGQKGANKGPTGGHQQECKNVRTNTPLPPNGGRGRISRSLPENPETTEQRNFAAGHTLYPGRKRGWQAEFQSFTRTHPDWKSLLDDNGFAQCIQTLIHRQAYSAGFWPTFQRFNADSLYEQALYPTETRT